MTTVRETSSFDDITLKRHEAPMVLSPRRRRRPGTIALGLGLVLLAALAGAIRADAGSESVVAVLITRSMVPGEQLTVGHLVAIEIEPAPGLDWVSVDEQDELLGRSARGPIEPGRLAVRSMFDERADTVGAGRVVIPAAIGRGGIPPSLLVGDRVRMHGFRLDPGPSADPTSLGTAVVWSVRHGEGTLPSLVELLVEDEREAAITNAAADGVLRLNLVGGG